MTNRFQQIHRDVLIVTLVLGHMALTGACSGPKQHSTIIISDIRAKDADDCCNRSKPETSGRSAKLDFIIPNVELLDQDGQRVHFYTDLVQGKTVVISFFFTSCTTVCPPLTAIMSQVQRDLLLEGRSDIQFISISVDPTRDTPPRLKAWSKNFSAQPGWVFLTGNKSRVDRLLKSLHSFTPAPQDHTPMVLIGYEPQGVWKQVNGLSSAKAIADAVRRLADEPDPSNEQSIQGRAPLSDRISPEKVVRKVNESAHSYFGDIVLTDQNGNSHRLYTDLMRGRILLVNSFFSTCTGVCPIMARKIKDIRQAFSDRVGKDFVVLSISVDPQVDTPARLNEYAKNLRAGAGWYFLTGTKENVEEALHKFGMRVESRESHSNLFLIGNDVTDYWKKLFSLAPTEEIIPAVAGVFHDDSLLPSTGG